MNDSGRFDALEFFAGLYLWGSIIAGLLLAVFGIVEIVNAPTWRGVRDPEAIGVGVGLLVGAVVAPISGWAVQLMYTCLVQIYRTVSRLEKSLEVLTRKLDGATEASVIAACGGDQADWRETAPSSLMASRELLANGTYRCSNCGSSSPTAEADSAHCGHCGAVFRKVSHSFLRS